MSIKSILNRFKRTQHSDLIVFKGLVLAEGRSRVRLGEDTVRYVSPSEYDFYEFVSTPRTIAEVTPWLQSAGLTHGFLKSLIDEGLVARISDYEDVDYLDEFAGLRLRPLGHLDFRDPESGCVWIGATPDSSAQLPVAPSTAQLIWFREEGEDIPTTARRLADGDLDFWGGDLDIWGRALKFDFCAILENKLAWISDLEPTPPDHDVKAEST